MLKDPRQPGSARHLAGATNAEDRYTPNHISLDKRAAYLVVSSAIIIYAVASLIQDDFYIWFPGKRGRNISEHLHGTAAWLAAGATFAAASNLLAVVVDHYDRRNNERNYRAYARFSFLLAIALLVLAFIAHGFYKRYPG